MTLTALFALLLGGHQPVYYVTHRMVDLGIGVVTGLAVDPSPDGFSQAVQAGGVAHAARDARADGGHIGTVLARPSLSPARVSAAPPGRGRRAARGRPPAR